eukprot:scaffold285_cov304-Pinguiococcus_pyrenoidosus.AAC.27
MKPSVGEESIFLSTSRRILCSHVMVSDHQVISLFMEFRAWADGSSLGSRSSSSSSQAQMILQTFGPFFRVAFVGIFRSLQSSFVRSNGNEPQLAAQGGLVGGRAGRLEMISQASMHVDKKAKQIKRCSPLQMYERMHQRSEQHRPRDMHI